MSPHITSYCFSLPEDSVHCLLQSAGSSGGGDSSSLTSQFRMLMVFFHGPLYMIRGMCCAPGKAGIISWEGCYEYMEYMYLVLWVFGINLGVWGCECVSEWSGHTAYLTYWWGSGPRRHPQSLLRHLGTYLAEHRAEKPTVSKCITADNDNTSVLKLGILYWELN